MLSFTRLQDFIRAPFCCIVKAKKQDMEQSVVQCVAQLIGAVCLNAREKKDIPALYGCATTGIEWRFLKFESRIFTLDEASYYINEHA